MQTLFDFDYFAWCFVLRFFFLSCLESTPRSRTVCQTQYQLSICICVCGWLWVLLVWIKFSYGWMCGLLNKLREHWTSTLRWTSFDWFMRHRQFLFGFQLFLFTVFFFPVCVAKYHKISKERTLEKLQIMLFTSHSSESQWQDVCLWKYLTNGKINIVRSSYFLCKSEILIILSIVEHIIFAMEHKKLDDVQCAVCTRV